MIVGIDLGTSNSLIAIFEQDGARVLPNAHGSMLTPSAVGVDDDGQILVGLAARERLISHPQQTCAAFKRYMGTDRRIAIGRREFRPEELSALVLRSLKADAEVATGQPIAEAVVTVPAYFNDAQRKATRAACELAELKVERLLNEPTAAALAYGLHRRDLESKFLVFDLGGGTFDVSLLELFEGVMEVRASAGDNFLGGEDFVDLLVQAFADATATQDELATPAFVALVRDRAERAKRTLSTANVATLQLTWQGRELSFRVDEAAFAKLSAPLLERLRAPVERALRDARLKARELDEVVLVGGATRMPLVRRVVAQMFGRIPSSQVDPDTVVAIGAAVQAGLKARHAALEEVVMTDVAPYSLGVDIVTYVAEDKFEPGRFMPIIERNTVVPVSRVETVYPVHERQKVVQLHVYQGESRLVKNNIKLGELRLELPPGKPKHENGIDVRFTYDINGLLEVEATLLSTGTKKRVVIEGNPGVLTAESIQQRLIELAKLKIHPREQAENRAVMARAERMYEQHLGATRELIGALIERFQALLSAQDERAIEQGRRAFSAELDALEGESYL